MNTRTSLAVFSGLWLLGCAPTAPIGTNRNPEDLSAGGHRHEAAIHLQEAVLDNRPAPGTSRMDTIGETTNSDEAIRQQRKAQIHLNDAIVLENAMHTECAPITPAERPLCGFGGRRVASVEDLPDGSRIRFAGDGAAVRETLSRARCAHAYADFVGRNSMPSCVVAVRDLSIAATYEQGTVVLTLTSSNGAVVPDLRRRAHSLMDHQGVTTTTH
ncbi:MAG: hypothetical protein WCJ30_03510 [Deltaproteobacteria bacterium]